MTRGILSVSHTSMAKSKALTGSALKKLIHFLLTDSVNNPVELLPLVSHCQVSCYRVSLRYAM